MRKIKTNSVIVSFLVMAGWVMFLIQTFVILINSKSYDGLIIISGYPMILLAFELFITPFLAFLSVYVILQTIKFGDVNDEKN